MIVAERSNLVRKSKIEKYQGDLTFKTGSIYSEFKIINQMGEEICALDYNNQIARIKPEPGYNARNFDDRCLTIQYRFVNGPRVFTNGYIESTLSDYGEFVIPYDVFITETVFVEEVNALFFNPRWHTGTLNHPHSKEYISQQIDKIRSEIARATVYSPITIIANDPSGKITQLFVELNGRICTVKVTNFKEINEDDVVAISIRGTTTGSLEECKIIRTSFTELFRKDPLCWEIEGFWISIDRKFFEQKLAIEKNKPQPNVVPSSEIEMLLSQARQEDHLLIQQQVDLIKQREQDHKELQRRYKELQDSYNDLVKGEYLQRNSTHAFRKLDIDEAKSRAAEREAILNRELEQLKLKKEQYNTWANIAKAVVVIVPVGLLVFNHFTKAPPPDKK